MIDYPERLKSITPAAWGTQAYYASKDGAAWCLVRSPVIAWAIVETKIDSDVSVEEYEPFDPRVEESVRPVVLSEGAPSWMESDRGLVHIRIPGAQSQDKDDESAIELAKFLAGHAMLDMSRDSLYGTVIYEHSTEQMDLV